MTTRIDSRTLRETTTPEDTVLTAAPQLGSSRRLPVASIRLDGGTQPRAELNQEHIADLAADLRTGAMLPPIDVMHDGVDYWLFDGYHRLHAHKAAHGANASIDVRVHQGSQQDAQWASYAVNRAHGLRRTTEDKQRAIVAALKHPNGASRSNRELARHLGVDHTTVGDWREKLELTGGIPQSTERTGSDGRTINTTNIGANQRRETYASGLPKLNLPLRLAGAPPNPDRQEGATGASVVASDATHTRQNGAPLGKCHVCNRPLYDPIQAAQGIGACCAAKQAAGVQAADERPLPDWVTAEPAPEDEEFAEENKRLLGKHAARLEQWIKRFYFLRQDLVDWGELTGHHVAYLPFLRELDHLAALTEAELAALAA